MSEDRTQNLPRGDLGEVISILRSIDGRLTSVETRLTSVETRLVALEDKVDRRLQETRPIWEQVLVRLTNVEERLTNVEQELVGVKQGMVKVEARLGKVEDEIDGLGRKFRVFNEDILKLQNKQGDLKERLDRIDPEHVR